jgi:hypothetical protein
MNKIQKFIRENYLIVILGIICFIIIYRSNSIEGFVSEELTRLSLSDLENIVLTDDEIFDATLKNIIPEEKKLIISTEIHASDSEEKIRYYLGYRKDICDHKLYLLDKQYPEYHYAFLLINKNGEYVFTSDDNKRVFVNDTNNNIEIINEHCENHSMNTDILPSMYELKFEFYTTITGEDKIYIKSHKNHYLTMDTSGPIPQLTLHESVVNGIKFDLFKYRES